MIGNMPETERDSLWLSTRMSPNIRHSQVSSRDPFFFPAQPILLYIKTLKSSWLIIMKNISSSSNFKGSTLGFHKSKTLCFRRRDINKRTRILYLQVWWFPLFITQVWITFYLNLLFIPLQRYMWSRRSFNFVIFVFMKKATNRVGATGEIIPFDL